MKNIREAFMLKTKRKQLQTESISSKQYREFIASNKSKIRSADQFRGYKISFVTRYFNYI